MKKMWRGPFSVERRVRSWVIVNAIGDVERTGFNDKTAANAMCDILNLSGRFCDDVPEDLYDAARLACHEQGGAWTDPRTGITFEAPAKDKP